MKPREMFSATTSERIQILILKIEDEDTPTKDRLEMIGLLQDFYSKEWDIVDWFKQLKDLTQDVVREAEIYTIESNGWTEKDILI